MKTTVFILSFILMQIALFGQQMSTEKYYARGIARDALGMYDDALSDFNELTKLTPNDAKVWNYRGLVYYHKKEYDKALADYNQAIKLDAKFEMAWFNKGILFLGNKQYEDAVSAFDEAININPLEESYSMRGQALIELKKYDGAIDDFNAALKLNPQNGYSYRELGIAKYLKEDINGACECFRKAVEFRDDLSQQYIDQFCK